MLELLVVLALVSFMTALVAPRLSNTVEAIGRSGERAEARRQLERLPLLARRAGTGFQLGPGQALSMAGLALPQGWSARSAGPLRISGNGFCDAAVLDVATPDGQERWQLHSPDCRIDDAP